MRKFLQSKMSNTFFALFLIVCLMLPVMAASAASVAAPGSAKKPVDSVKSSQLRDTASYPIPPTSKPIGFGETIYGQLTTSDPYDPAWPGCYADAYVFTGTSGQQIAITMTSYDFDTYLTLYKTDSATTMTGIAAGSGYPIGRIPDGSGYFTLPQSGDYVIIASSFDSYQTGSYSIMLQQATIGTVPTPTFSPPTGTYTSAQIVTISTATSGATIRYTTNGTEPTANSAIYTAPLTISSTTTLKAKAFKSGMTDSATATAVYTISAPPVTTMYDVQIYASAGGTVSPSGLQRVAAGGSLALMITPNTGYVVQSVNVTSVLESVAGSMKSLSQPLAAVADMYTLNNIQTNKVVSVLFQPLTYSVSGKITADSLTGTALSGATVTIGGKSATTASDGTYKVSGVPAGSQMMTVSKTGYATKAQTVAVTQSLTNVNIFLVPTATGYSISGKITSGSLTGAALPGATVSVKNGTTVVATTTTGTTGLYTLTAVPAGTYTLEVSKTGYWTKTVGIAVTQNLTNLNLFLVPTTTTTYSVSGKITSGSLTGAALPGATVNLKSGTTVVKSTITDTTGLYSMTAVPAGSYTLEVAKTGYVTKTQALTVSGNMSNVNMYLVAQTTTGAVQDLGGGVVQNLSSFNGKKIYHLISAQPTTKPEGDDGPATTYSYSLTTASGTASVTGNKITLSEGSNKLAKGVYSQGQIRADERLRKDENRALASKAKQYNKSLHGAMKSAPQPISVGTAWNNVNILGYGEAWTTINTTCRYVSNNAYFFVDNRDIPAMESYMATYGAAFDAIFAKNLSKFGAVNDVDQNNKVIVVFSQEVTNLGALGYFYAIDKFPTSTYAKSNTGDIFYITTRSDWQPYVKGTLAHELQHMIYFDQHYNRGVMNTYAWLNEALSQAAEYYNNELANHHAWIASYLKGGWPGLSLTHWTSGNYGYGAIYIRYLIDQYGDTAIKNMSATNLVGVKAVEAATGQDFNTIFENFTRAMVMSGTGDSTDSRYRFTTLNLQTVQPTGRGGLLTTSVNTAGGSVSGDLYPYRIYFGQWNGTFGTMNLTGADFKGAAFGLSR